MTGSTRTWQRTLLTAGLAGALSAVALFVGDAPANGFGENDSFDFRTPNERQVKLNVENTRLREAGELGVGGSTGTIGASQGGQPLGNETTINVGGSGNTVDVDQTNSGDQNVDSTIDGNVSVGD